VEGGKLGSKEGKIDVGARDGVEVGNLVGIIVSLHSIGTS